MAGTLTTIVTDGSIGLSENVAARYDVALIPRLFLPQWAILQRANPSFMRAMTEQQRLARRVYRVEPATVDQVLAEFRTFPENRMLISVHAARVFDNAYYQARIARGLLGAESRIALHECSAFGVATSFLVEAVAAFAQSGPTTLAQAQGFIQRLEHETLTVLLAPRLGKLACNWQTGQQRWQHRLRGWLGQANAYCVAKDRLHVEPLDGWPHRFTWRPPSAQATDVLVEAFPSRRAASSISKRLGGLDFVRAVDTRRSVVAGAHWPASFVAVHFVPTPERVHQIGVWIRQQSA